MSDAVLAVHIAAGVAGLALGAVMLWIERSPAERSLAGGAYEWAVLAIAATALALVALDPARLWWLAPLAVLAYGLARLGRAASARPPTPAWIRAYAHGQGGSYIALVTATLVVVTDGALAVAAWIVPTAVGFALIERRVARLRAAVPARRSAAEECPARSPGPRASGASRPGRTA